MTLLCTNHSSDSYQIGDKTKSRENRFKKQKGYHRAHNPKNDLEVKNRFQFGEVFRVDPVSTVFRFVVSRTFPNTLKNLKNSGNLKLLRAVITLMIQKRKSLQ